MEEQTVSTEANEVNEPTTESVTKELEDSLYENKTEVETQDSQTAEASEDPQSEDKVAEAKDDKESQEGDEAEVEYKLEWTEDSVFKELAGDQGLDDLKSWAKEHKLSPESAKSLLEREEKMLAGWAKNNADAFDKEVEEWKQEVEADQTLGGENFSKTKEDARRAVEKFGSDGFTDLLVNTGYANHPEVVRFLAHVGSLMSNDTLIVGETDASKVERPMHEYFYNNKS